MRNLIPTMIQQYNQQGQYTGEFKALTMFVDVAGFTAMTQTLMRAGHEGAEVLAAILNRVFELAVNAVYAHGGFITTFAGDAFTAVFPVTPEDAFPEVSALHVLTCAERIQAIFRCHGVHVTPYGQFTLQVKVGLSGGKVEWGIVGQTALAYFFRGAAIDGCAAAEHQADKGEIILDVSVERLFPLDLIETEPVVEGYRRLRKLPSLLRQQLPRLQQPRRPRLQRAIVARFLPEAVIDFKERGEFRPVVPVFIAFAGLDTISQLDRWVTGLLRQIAAFGGYFHHLDFGDKGGVAICGFGAPAAHENMVDRALNFIAAVQKELRDPENLPHLEIRAGITYGMAYAGIAGGTKRCEYTCYGEVVNLAARLMLHADWGNVLVSAPVCQRTEQFTFEHLGDFQYKGITEPIPTFRLLNHRAGQRRQTFAADMIGRQTELQQLQAFAAPIFSGRFAGLAAIFGEAGIGKSRLAYALKETLCAHKDLDWFHCPADQILRKPLNPFISFLMSYFEQLPEQTVEENQSRFEARYQALVSAISPHPSHLPEAEGATVRFEEIRSELLRTKAIIAAQIGLFWPESLWEQLDAKGKYENTLDALKNFFLAHSLFKPVVIELEDGHWLDNDSLALLTILTRNIADYPIFLLATLRYHDDGTKFTFPVQGIPILDIDLNLLSAAEVKCYAELELKGDIDAELHALLVKRTRGNPFYVQQMVLYFLEHGRIALREHAWRLAAATSNVPESIQAVLIARIDRLSQQIKALVKVAAVIGRKFDVLLLSAVLKQDVRHQVKRVEKSQIWEQVQELEYLFTHALIRDAAYHMQLRARLRDLHHLTADAMETVYAGNLSEKYADLAFHYEQAEIQAKTIEYLIKAGDQAKARYQNQQALNFYDRVCLHLQRNDHGDERICETLLKKAEILNLIGEWRVCQQVCTEVFRLAEKNGKALYMGRARLLSGDLFTDTGKYDEALACYDEAMILFERVRDTLAIGQTLRNIGIVYRYTGEFDKEMAYYERSLVISKGMNDHLSIAKNISNIGLIYTMQGDYAAGLIRYQHSLQILEHLEEKLNRSRVLNNIGLNYELQNDYDGAMTYYHRALAIAEELGDKFQMATELGNIGLVHALQGNPALAIPYFDRAITIGRELESKYYLCSSLIDKADALLALQQYAEAREFAMEGLHLAEEIGEREYILKGQALSAKLALASRQPETSAA